MEGLHRRPSLVPVFVWRGIAIGRIARSCGSRDLTDCLAMRGSRLRVCSLDCVLVGFVGEVGKRRGASRGATQEL